MHQSVKLIDTILPLVISSPLIHAYMVVGLEQQQIETPEK